MAIDDNLELESTGRPGPGQRLREGRLRRGLEVEWVANQLHLKPYMVEALETNDYDQLPSPVFVKGYLRNYARLVAEPVDTVLTEYLHSIGDAVKEADNNVRVVQGSGEKFDSGHVVVKLVSWGIILATLTLFLIAGLGRINWDELSIGSITAQAQSWFSSEDKESADSQPEKVEKETTETVTEEQAVADVSNDTATSADAVVVESEESASQTTEAEASEEVSAVEVVNTDTEAAVAEETATSEAEVAEVMPQPQPQPQPQVDEDVIIQMTGTSWVEVKDSTGKFKLSRKALLPKPERSHGKRQDRKYHRHN